MRVDRIRLVGFRSFREKELHPTDITLLVGPNASGKTNLIEAVRLATATTSFRKPVLADVVRRGDEEAVVDVEATGDSSHIEIRMRVSAEGARTYTVNGSAKRRLSDVARLVPSVVFTPDDLRIVKDAARVRRESLDDIGERLWSTYGTITTEYARAVRQRNRLLREGAGATHTGPWTEQVVGLGGRLLSLRTRLLARLRPSLTEAYASIAGGEILDVSYLDVQGLPPDAWKEGIEPDEGSEAIRSALERCGPEEGRRRLTLVGPHRDDIGFTISGADARSFASQGQQRSIALAWKIAELAVLQAVTRRRPVLLLDDVMSELDETRRAALTGLLGEETQAFITTTNLGYFDRETLSRAEVFSLP